MLLEEIWSKIENALENEEISIEDLFEYEVELCIDDIMQPKGLIDFFHIDLNHEDRIIKIITELY